MGKPGCEALLAISMREHKMLSVRLDSLRREGHKFSVILCKDIMKLFWSNGPTKSLSSFFETHPPLRLSRSPLSLPLSPSYFDSRMTEETFSLGFFFVLCSDTRPPARARIYHVSIRPTKRNGAPSHRSSSFWRSNINFGATAKPPAPTKNVQ